MEPLAKPSGITYRDHRQHVYEEALGLLGANAFWAKKYKELTGENLTEQVRRAAWWHDQGKLHKNWKTACESDYALYREWRQQNGLAPDEVSAADFKRYEWEMRKLMKSSSPGLMKAKLRHEFDSLKQATEKIGSDNPLTLAESVAIAAHHSKLSERHKKRWFEDGRKTDRGEGPFSHLWKSLEEQSKNLIESFPYNKQEWEEKVLERYKIAGVRALLRLADTRASRAEAGDTVPEIMPFDYNFVHPERNGVQRIAEEVACKSLASILRAPTGSGKTDAAMLWAKKQIDEGQADRLVVAMPTRFTSNALAMSVDKNPNYGSTGLYHSSAWYNRYGKVTDAEKSNARELHKLAQLLITPVTVCTIDHLLLSLTGTKEDHHSTFFFLANSAVVFDEADFYDPFVQANMLVLLETLKILQVPVLIMSATVPDSSRVLYNIEDEILDVPAEANSPNRSIVWRGPAETPEDVEGILKGMVRQRTGIVYANTVDRAYAYYEWFKNQHEYYGGPKPILYHSRFTEPHKKDIEGTLLAALGKDAWHDENQIPEGIAILTQIGEMSVNISAPLMLSDACPWDRLAQRAGRLDRFGLSPNGGILYVIEPLRNGKPYPAPYGEFEREGGWIPAEALSQTIEELRTTFDEVPQQVSPRDFVDWVNNLYPTHSGFEERIKQNSDKLKKLMRTNWMIVSDQFTDEDDASVSNEWKSRDIPPQDTVFVELPKFAENYSDEENKAAYPFQNWDHFRSYQLEQGISCPKYMTNKAGKSGEFMKFAYQIGDDDETKFLWLTADGVYKSDTGLANIGKAQKTDRASGNFV